MKTELDNSNIREVIDKSFEAGKQEAFSEIKKIVKQYIDKGNRCIEQSETDMEEGYDCDHNHSEDEEQCYNRIMFWDGFTNCAENIFRELSGLQIDKTKEIE